MANKMCKIPYVHDFPDYPCKICSPKEFEEYKNMNQEEIINDWESKFDKKWVKMFEESSWPIRRNKISNTRIIKII